MGICSCVKVTQPTIRVPFNLSKIVSESPSKIHARVGVENFIEIEEFSLRLEHCSVYCPPTVPQGTISDGVTGNFVYYLHELNLFENVLREPFDVKDVDIILTGKIVKIQSKQPDYKKMSIISSKYGKVTGSVAIELQVNNIRKELIKNYKEETSTTIEIDTFGVGIASSFDRFRRRPDIMQSMTETFEKLSKGLVQDKAEIMAAVESGSKIPNNKDKAQILK